MKQKLLRIIPVFVSIVTVFSLIPSQTTYAAPSSIYFSPANGTYNVNSNFSVQIRGTSDPVYYQYGSTSGTVNFPNNRLRAVSVSTSGSSYSDMNATINNTTGTVTWTGSAFPSPTSIYFFTINFQALSAGSAPLTFSAETNVNHNWYYQINSTNRTNATYTIVTPPPPTCPAGQVGTPPNCTTPPPATCPAGKIGTPPNCTTPPPPTPGGGGTPNPTPTPKTPTITDTAVPTPTAQPDVTPVQVDAGDLSIKDVVAKVTRQSNALTWKTSLPDATTELSLGTSKENLTVKPTVIKESDGSYISTMENLKPGVRYYFTIVATAKDNPDKKATFSGAFTTRGYPVKLVITKDGKKISGASITVEKQTFKTDKNGELSLELTDSTFNASVSLPDNQGKKTVTFTVAKKTIPSNGGNPDTQTFTFDLTEQEATAAGASNPLLWPIIGAAGAIAALILGAILFLLYRRRKADETAAATPATAEAYAWEQGSAAPELTPPMYVQSVNQQSSDLASIEQQFIPETEPQPQDIYEAQALATEPQTIEPATEPSFEENIATVSPEVTESLFEPSDTIAAAPEEFVAQPTEAEVQDIAPAPNQIPEEIAAITQHETTELSDLPPEEEAVYHPDTGELDIIHGHHNQPIEAVAPPVELPESPVPDTVIENSDVENLPLPPEPAEQITNLPPEGKVNV